MSVLGESSDYNVDSKSPYIFTIPSIGVGKDVMEYLFS